MSFLTHIRLTAQQVTRAFSFVQVCSLSKEHEVLFDRLIALEGQEGIDAATEKEIGMVGGDMPGYPTFMLNYDATHEHKMQINFDDKTSLILYSDQDYSSKFVSFVTVDHSSEPQQLIDIEAVDMSLTVIQLEKAASGQLQAKTQPDGNKYKNTRDYSVVQNRVNLIVGPLNQVMLLGGLRYDMVVSGTATTAHPQMWTANSFKGPHGGKQEKLFYNGLNPNQRLKIEKKRISQPRTYRLDLIQDGVLEGRDYSFIPNKQQMMKLMNSTKLQSFVADSYVDRWKSRLNLSRKQVQRFKSLRTVGERLSYLRVLMKRVPKLGTKKKLDVLKARMLLRKKLQAAAAVKVTACQDIQEGQILDA